jgi:hypothetical protein
VALCWAGFHDEGLNVVLLTRFVVIQAVYSVFYCLSLNLRLVSHGVQFVRGEIVWASSEVYKRCDSLGIKSFMLSDFTNILGQTHENFLRI